MITKLITFARELDEAWDLQKAVEWQEAEDLVQRLKALDKSIIDSNSELQDILAYAAETEEWDCAYVGTWPATISSTLGSPSPETPVPSSAEMTTRSGPQWYMK